MGMAGAEEVRGHWERPSLQLCAKNRLLLWVGVSPISTLLEVCGLTLLIVRMCHLLGRIKEICLLSVNPGQRGTEMRAGRWGFTGRFPASGTRPTDQLTPRVGGQSHSMTFQQLLAWPGCPSPTLCFCVGQDEAAQITGRRPWLPGGSRDLDQPIWQTLILLDTQRESV